MRKHLSGKLQTILTGDFRLWWGAEVRFGSLSEVKAIRFAVRSPQRTFAVHSPWPAFLARF
jgi:hypothetical protein